MHSTSRHKLAEAIFQRCFCFQRAFCNPCRTRAVLGSHYAGILAPTAVAFIEICRAMTSSVVNHMSCSKEPCKQCNTQKFTVQKPQTREQYLPQARVRDPAFSEIGDLIVVHSEDVAKSLSYPDMYPANFRTPCALAHGTCKLACP